MGDIESQTLDPLALTQCPRCDYNLHGLPAEGVCPECGRPYDQRSIILRGWAAGQKHSPWWNLLSVSAWALPALMMRFGVGSVMMVMGLGAIAGVVMDRLRPPSARVKLNEHGCAQYENPSVTSLLDLQSRTLYLICMFVVWGIVCYLQPGPHPILPLFIFAAAMCVIVAWRCLRDRNLRANLQRREQYFDEHETPATVIPWTKAQMIKLTSTSGGDRPRLRITSVQTFWKPERIYVDAKLICSSRQGSALRNQIQLWQLAARNPTNPR